MKLTEADYLELLRTNDAVRMAVAHTLAALTAEPEQTEQTITVADLIESWD